ncbi:MAG: F0F1 ATP synthase subunit A, partial [Pseudomonadota bacterium]
HQLALHAAKNKCPEKCHGDGHPHCGAVFGAFIGIPSLTLMVAISALEILVAGIQAYVFALLTSLYINDAEHLH